MVKFPKEAANVLTALFSSNAEIYAHRLYWAIRAVDKYAIIDLMCCVDDVKMEDIIEAYNNYCGANADLKSDIKGAFLVNLGKLLGAILEGKRRPSIPGRGNISSSEIGVCSRCEECMWIKTIWDPVIRIFSQYSYEELVYFARQHVDITGLTLEQSIRIETAGLYYFRRLLLKILQYAGDPQHITPG
ncbi:Annexin A5 [Orchesella cincta]|uniref:Annexin A5 n=1 Tax=Orchesella cincta TaxID=48709 RepID=A0A1D2M3C4_ORCCI|nr:Annexin A5 [Orchesella cincta]